MLFEAMAAVVIGGVSLQGGIGKLTGVFAGAILLNAISTAISILGMPPFYMNVIRSNNWWCGAPADQIGKNVWATSLKKTLPGS